MIKTLPKTMPLTNTSGLNSKKKREFQGRELVREAVRRRDNRTCQMCSKKWDSSLRRFDVHHLNNLCGKKSRKYDKVANTIYLITLCHKCHMNLHPTKERMSNQLWDIEKTNLRNSAIVILKKNNYTNRQLSELFLLSEARIWKICKTFTI